MTRDTRKVASPRRVFGRVTSLDYPRAMVNLTRIYTRTGDAGETRLGDMSATTKTDLRLAAYADVDEANAHLGVALAAGRPGTGRGRRC